MDRDVSVTLRPYASGDLDLLRGLLGDAGAMTFLGGPESEEAILARHERYLAADPATNALFVIEADREPVGWIGLWVTAADVLEAGWHVLRTRQGRGIASAALARVLARAREMGGYSYVDAYPAPENKASNALCARAGFERLGETEVEYPKGHMMRAVHWRYDLRRE